MAATAKNICNSWHYWSFSWRCRTLEQLQQFSVSCTKTIQIFEIIFSKIVKIIFLSRPDQRPVKDLIEPQYINLKNNVKPAQEIKSMIITKHLRKHWKLMHKANHGDMKQHLNAVKNLSMATKNVCDGEVRELGM